MHPFLSLYGSKDCPIYNFPRKARKRLEMAKKIQGSRRLGLEGLKARKARGSKKTGSTQPYCVFLFFFQLSSFLCRCLASSLAQLRAPLAEMAGRERGQRQCQRGVASHAEKDAGSYEFYCGRTRTALSRISIEEKKYVAS